MIVSLFLLAIPALSFYFIYKVVRKGKGLLFPNFSRAWEEWDASRFAPPTLLEVILFAASYYFFLAISIGSVIVVVFALWGYLGK